jgi:hypothetical protein
MHRRAALAPLFLFASAIPFAPAALAAAKPLEPTYGHRTPQAARAALNREEADKAKQQAAANLAARDAFQQAEVAREAQIARDKEAYEQDKARLAAEHEAAMALWREDVLACRDGDTPRCKVNRSVAAAK